MNKTKARKGKNKDISARELEQFPDVYADILNVLLFDGKKEIRAEELADWPSRSSYFARGMLRELERDTPKHWIKDNECLACFGLENQTKPEKDMPLRIYAYDGAEYRTQLLKENRKKKRYPVVTIVLYFNAKDRWTAETNRRTTEVRHWTVAKTLHESVNVPEILRKYVSNPEITVFDIAALPKETAEMFNSDFHEIADYYVQLRETGDYKPSPDRQMGHPEAVLKLLSALTDDDRFLEAWEDGEGEVKKMCEVLDRIEEKGRKEGRKEGIFETLLLLVQDNILTIQEAAARAGVTESVFRAKMTEHHIS